MRRHHVSTDVRHHLSTDVSHHLSTDVIHHLSTDVNQHLSTDVSHHLSTDVTSSPPPFLLSSSSSSDYSSLFSAFPVSVGPSLTFLPSIGHDLSSPLEQASVFLRGVSSAGHLFFSEGRTSSSQSPLSGPIKTTRFNVVSRFGAILGMFLGWTDAVFGENP